MTLIHDRARIAREDPGGDDELGVLVGSRGKNQCRIVPHGLSGDDLNRRRLVDISGIADFEVHRPGGNDGNAVLTQIGRTSCRESVCQYVSISVVAVSLKKKQKMTQKNSRNTTQDTYNS